MKLTQLIEAGDADGVARLFAALSEQERRKFADEARAAFKRFDTFDATLEQRVAAHSAIFSTATLAELAKQAKSHLLGADAVALWRTQRPSWLPRAAEVLVDANVFYAPLARRLVNEGLSEKPRSENYAIGLLVALSHRTSRDWNRPLVARLLDDPSVLEEDVWRLFEVEGSGEHSLAAHDKYSPPEQTWASALLSLSRDGHLSRARLFDVSLAALERDFAAFRVGWFSRFHELLEPTAAERSERVASYLRLLGSPIAPTVSFAMDALAIVDAHAPLRAEQVLPFVAPVLAARGKGVAKSALELLGKIADREPAQRAAIAEAIKTALSHETTDVQKRALALLEKLGTDRAEIAENAPLLAPSLKKQVGAKNAPVARTTRPRVTPLDRPLQPVQSLDELIERFAHVLEDDSDPDEIDLVLDGVCRLCAERPTDFAVLTGPLAKRAKAVLARDMRHPLAFVMAGVARAWLAEEKPVSLPPELGVDFPRVFAARAAEVAQTATSRRPRALLSAPTHRGGVVEARALIERIAAIDELPIHDAVIALLRLSPDPAVAVSARGELADATRYALGHDVAVGPTTPLWIAAARARGGDQPTVRKRHGDLGPDAAIAAELTPRHHARTSGKYTFHELAIDVEPKSTKPWATTLPTVLLHARMPHATILGWEKHIVRWASTVWPRGSESFFGAAIPHYSRNLDWSAAEWHNLALLEPLRDPCTHYGPLATLLLGLGLGAKEPGESGLATDAAIAALEDGRLTGEALGETMATLLPTGIIKAARWAKTLSIVATACPGDVAIAIQRALHRDGPRDLGALVDLLVELLADGRITDDAAWAFLSTSRFKAKVRSLR